MKYLSLWFAVFVALLCGGCASTTKLSKVTVPKTLRDNPATVAVTVTESPSIPKKNGNVLLLKAPIGYLATDQPAGSFVRAFLMRELSSAGYHIASGGASDSAIDVAITQVTLSDDGAVCRGFVGWKLKLTGKGNPVEKVIKGEAAKHYGLNAAKIRFNIVNDAMSDALLQTLTAIDEYYTR